MRSSLWVLVFCRHSLAPALRPPPRHRRQRRRRLRRNGRVACTTRAGGQSRQPHDHLVSPDSGAPADPRRFRRHRPARSTVPDRADLAAVGFRFRACRRRHGRQLLSRAPELRIKAVQSTARPREWRIGLLICRRSWLRWTNRLPTRSRRTSKRSLRSAARFRGAGSRQGDPRHRGADSEV